MSAEPDIIYTKVDEAPELASGSFLPIIQAFAGTAGVNVGTKDISLAGRIISQFPEWLKPEQQQPDDLALLGEIVMTPESNVIKLPNISASIPQIKGCVAELQSQGYNIPDYPEEPKNDVVANWGRAVANMDGDSTKLYQGLVDYLWELHGKEDITRIVQDHLKEVGYGFIIEEEDEDDWGDDW